MAPVVGGSQDQGMPMFVPMPQGLEEGPGAFQVVAPPPGLPLHLPCMPPCGPPPGLERPLPCVGDRLLALARGEQVASTPPVREAGRRPATPGTPSTSSDDGRQIASGASLKLTKEAGSRPAAPGTPTSSDDGGKQIASGALLKLTEALSPADSSPPPPSEDSAADKPVFDLWRDDALAEAILRPLLDDVLGGSGQMRSKGGKQAAGSGAKARWWSRPDIPLLCPLTRFPICLLPYPPFKLRVDPKRSSPHRLVDGKFLAIQHIATGNSSACGRELVASDLSALDDYVHRCKLGPYRPGRAAALAEDVTKAETPQRRAEAAEEHDRFVAAARAELGKLRRIQENRLLQISKALPADATVSKHQQGRSRFGSSTSTASTVASCSIGEL